MDTRELAWAAGLFDGEGCITIDRAWSNPKLYLGMTDEDSVRRFHAAVGGIGAVRREEVPNYKPRWCWQVASFEKVQAVLCFLWYGLCDRRKARAIEVLAQAQDAQRNRRYQRRGFECSIAECEKPVVAKQLCQRHYRLSRKAA